MAKKTKKKRKSGVPTGNAGEYFVMGELLRRGLDAQLADRNTKGYDILVRSAGESSFRSVQVKTVRAQPWYANAVEAFTGELLDQVTVYVLLGREDGTKPVRFFLVKNNDVKGHVHRPKNWRLNGFMSLKALEKYEDNWDAVRG